MKHYLVWQLVIVSGLLAAGPVYADGDAAAGKEKSASCAGCHGMNGEGMAENPAIAGMDGEAFISAMQAYKSGENPDPMMGMIMPMLSDEDIANLAAYYASLSSAE